MAPTLELPGGKARQKANEQILNAKTHHSDAWPPGGGSFHLGTDAGTGTMVTHSGRAAGRHERDVIALVVAPRAANADARD